MVKPIEQWVRDKDPDWYELVGRVEGELVAALQARGLQTDPEREANVTILVSMSLIHPVGVLGSILDWKRAWGMGWRTTKTQVNFGVVEGRVSSFPFFGDEDVPFVLVRTGWQPDVRWDHETLRWKGKFNPSAKARDLARRIEKRRKRYCAAAERGKFAAPPDPPAGDLAVCEQPPGS